MKAPLQNSSWLFLRLAGVAAVCGFAQLAGAATAHLPSWNTSIGSQFSLPLTLNAGNSPLGRYDVDLRYNPTALAVTSIDGGVGEFSAPLFTSTNTPGRILLSDENLTSLSSPTGSIVVAQISFTAVGNPGSTSTVTFASAALLDTDAITLPTTATPATIQIAGLPAVVKMSGTNAQRQTTFSLPLTVNSGSRPLGRYEAELHFTPTVVQLTGITGIAPLSSVLVNTNTPGTLILSADNITSLISPTGEVAVANLTFLAIGGLNSSTPLTIFSSTVLDTDASSLAVTNISALVMVDTDGDSDSVPDWWELRYFGSTNANLALDQDGDGVISADEFVADTNPTNAASYLRFTGVNVLTNGVKLDWLGGISATQYLQRALSIGGSDNWFSIRTSLPPTPLSGSYTGVLGTNATQFYRIKATR